MKEINQMDLKPRTDCTMEEITSSEVCTIQVPDNRSLNRILSNFDIKIKPASYTCYASYYMNTGYIKNIDICIANYKLKIVPVYNEKMSYYFGNKYYMKKRINYEMYKDNVHVYDYTSSSNKRINVEDVFGLILNRLKNKDK